MANVIKDFLGYLKLGDDEDDLEDYIEDYDEEISTRSNMRNFRKPAREPEKIEESIPKRASRSERSYGNDNESEEPRRVTRMERTSSNKIVPIRTTPRGLEVCIMKPSSFEDSQDICDMLLSGRAAVVNLEGFDPDDAQRVMDFISGCVYAINGKLRQISRYIFIFSPDSIDISGDYADIVGEDMGFGVPMLNKEF